MPRPAAVKATSLKPPTPPPAYRPQVVQRRVAAPAPRATSTTPVVPPAALRGGRRASPQKPGQPAAVQRYIAKGTVVYYSDTTSFTNKSKENFERALAVLGGPPENAR